MALFLGDRCFFCVTIVYQKVERAILTRQVYQALRCHASTCVEAALVESCLLAVVGSS